VFVGAMWPRFPTRSGRAIRARRPPSTRSGWAAELGQLGHPPSLDDEPVTASLRAAPVVTEPFSDRTKG
jgi:hypothetical protein